MLFDPESTLLDTYGSQEGEGATFIIRHMAIIRCSAAMVWPVICLKAEIREGCPKHGYLKWPYLLDREQGI